jgi:uncharacterized phage-associated protein
MDGTRTKLIVKGFCAIEALVLLGIGGAMPTANEVADWIVRHSADDLGAPVDSMSLEKMLYYAQAFYLVMHDKPLFPDEIRAWQWGPVVKAVWQRYQEHGNKLINSPKAKPPTLNSELEEYLVEVVYAFGQYTATRLSEATHHEDPWTDARHGYERQDSSDVLMPQHEINIYYRNLTEAGEDALSRHELLDVMKEPEWHSLYIAGICARKITKHPFFDGVLAKRLNETITNAPSIPKNFFEAPKGRDFVCFDENSDADAIIKNILVAK